MMESSRAATEGLARVRCNQTALRARDVLLPINIALIEARYAFRKSAVPHLVGNEFGVRDQMTMRIILFEVISRNPG